MSDHGAASSSAWAPFTPTAPGRPLSGRTERFHAAWLARPPPPSTLQFGAPGAQLQTGGLPAAARRVA
eukprot:5907149-Pyramimonas_sp.AAC.1